MKKQKEPTSTFFRVKRGLCAYVSYLAACDMNQAFSEYVLYEPILRILTSQGYTVKCEYECPGVVHAGVGDKKRLDFYATGHDVEFAMEVKWAKSHRPTIDNDIKKLEGFAGCAPGARAFLCVFGRRSHIKTVEIDRRRFDEQGKAVFADLRKTRYGCRIFRLKKRTGNSSRTN